MIEKVLLLGFGVLSWAFFELKIPNPKALEGSEHPLQAKYQHVLIEELLSIVG